jgi:ELWxxDGT repeat protein
LFGRELWVSDGTDPGTGRLTDINPGGGSSSVSFMCQAGAREVFFAAENASNGVELWSINRSLPTPQMVQNLHPDLGPNARSSNPRFMQMLNGRLVFVADDGTHGYELMQLFPGATARNTGHGCRADGPAPTIGSSDPILGSKLSVSVDSGRALQHGVVVLGLPNRSARDLGYGCELWFDPGLPHFVLPILTLQSGVATRDFQIPNTPALQGGTVVLQAGLGPTNTAPLGADLSAGLQLTVGL